MCVRKLSKRQPKVSYAVDEIVAEIEVPTTDSDTLFIRFVQHNRDDLIRFVQEQLNANGMLNFVSYTNIVMQNNVSDNMVTKYVAIRSLRHSAYFFSLFVWFLASYDFSPVRRHPFQQLPKTASTT